jgi:hypothetical protein
MLRVVGLQLSGRIVGENNVPVTDGKMVTVL